MADPDTSPTDAPIAGGATLDTSPPVDAPATDSKEDEPLLSPSFLGKLKRLQIISKKAFKGRMKGERRSLKRGQSVEFADFRNYVHGDDPRFIDWNTYARLERLYLKLFMEEEDLFVYLLVDCSASMESSNKFHFARSLAAALAYISVLNQDHVSLGGFRGQLSETLRPQRGKSTAPKILDFLTGLKPEGQTSLVECARRFLLENRRAGLVIVISDFLDPSGYEEGIKMLQARRHDVFLMQVLSPEELNPEIRGDMKLVDAETGLTTEVSISPRLLAQYLATVQQFCGDLEEFAKRRGAGYLLANSGEDLEDLVLRYFRKAGLVK
jgi:uncharacterized protein (DUF58 family)